MLKYKLTKLGLSVNLPTKPTGWAKFRKAISIAAKSRDNL